MMRNLRMYWLLLCCGIILTTLMCSSASANTPDCNVALETCKSDCAQRKIYDRERGGIVTQTDFVSQCQSACQDAAQWCLKQDSTTSCTTFAYHCESQCPWSVVDETHNRLQHTDSFRQCETSCTAGGAACEPFRKSLPPRKRTAEFDTCQEAQTACYADCVVEIKDLKQDMSIIDTDYPDICAKACAQGVQDCQTVEDSCDVYETSCWGSCPSSVTAFGQEKSDPMVKQWCKNSCAVGRSYCRSLQGLAFDRSTAPAVKVEPAPVQPATPAPQAPASKPFFTNPFAAKPAQPKGANPAPHIVSVCAKAENYCKEDCRKNKIINVMNGIWPQRYSNEAETDFWQQCESACAAAKTGCLASNGFKTPCQNACPRAYHDKASGNTYPENDAQNRCQWSCAIGQEAYEGKENRDICEIGYDDCEGDCSDMSDTFGADADNFYNTCEASCKAGKTQCPKALFYAYCDDFNKSCTERCPESSQNDDQGAYCQQACGDGAHKCQDRADVRYD